MGSQKVQLTGNTPGGADKNEIKKLYSDAEEVESSDDDAPASPHQDNLDLPAINLLRGLIELAPFANYVTRQAVLRYTHKTLQGRIAKYEQDHPRTAKFCSVADLTLRLIFTLVLVITVSAIIYKTVMPLPDPFG